VAGTFQLALDTRPPTVSFGAVVGNAPGQAMQVEVTTDETIAQAQMLLQDGRWVPMVPGAGVLVAAVPYDAPMGWTHIEVTDVVGNGWLYYNAVEIAPLDNVPRLFLRATAQATAQLVVSVRRPLVLSAQAVSAATLQLARLGPRRIVGQLGHAVRAGLGSAADVARAVVLRRPKERPTPIQLELEVSRRRVAPTPPTGTVPSSRHHAGLSSSEADAQDD
jgi:hypothetical protein